MAVKPNSGRIGRPTKELSPKERVFVVEFLKDMHAQSAALRAGFTGATAGSVLVGRDRVKREIDRLLAVRSVRTGITAERVLAELGNLAFANPAELFKKDGSLKPWNELTPDQAKMIGGVKTRKTVELGDDGKPKPIEVVEYAFVNKLAALTLTMRHLGMFNDHISVEFSSLADRMYAAQQRLIEGKAPKQIEGTIVLEGEAEEVPLLAEDLI